MAPYFGSKCPLHFEQVKILIHEEFDPRKISGVLFHSVLFLPPSAIGEGGLWSAYPRIPEILPLPGNQKHLFLPEGLLSECHYLNLLVVNPNSQGRCAKVDLS